MSMRLQVIFDEDELSQIREIAARRGMTVSEWTRQALRAAREKESSKSKEFKLRALDRALAHEFPTGDIDQMLDEIARGYGPLPK